MDFRPAKIDIDISAKEDFFRKPEKKTANGLKIKEAGSFSHYLQSARFASSIRISSFSKSSLFPRSPGVLEKNQTLSEPPKTERSIERPTEDFNGSLNEKKQAKTSDTDRKKDLSRLNEKKDSNASEADKKENPSPIQELSNTFNPKEAEVRDSAGKLKSQIKKENAAASAKEKERAKALSFNKNVPLSSTPQTALLKEEIAEAKAAAQKEEGDSKTLAADKKRASLETITEENLRENIKENLKEKDSFVRVLLDQEKWNIRRSRKASSSSREETQNSALNMKIGKQKKSKYAEGKSEDGNSQRDANSSSQSEEVSMLFSTNRKSIEANGNLRPFSSFLSKEQAAIANKRLYDRLVQKAKVNLRSDGSSSASIHMRPRSLGKMTLNIEVFQKHVQAQFIVESQAAKHILMEELNYFQEELQRQGIQADSLVVRVRDSLESQSPFARDHDKGDQQQMDKNSRRQTDSKDFDSHNSEEEYKVLEETGEHEHSALVLQSFAEEYETSGIRRPVLVSANGIDINA